MCLLFFGFLRNLPQPKIRISSLILKKLNDYTHIFKSCMGQLNNENYITAINRAIDSYVFTGFDPEDHFRSVTKMVTFGSGAKIEINDFMLPLCWIIIFHINIKLPAKYFTFCR